MKLAKFITPILFGFLELQYIFARPISLHDYRVKGLMMTFNEDAGNGDVISSSSKASFGDSSNNKNSPLSSNITDTGVKDKSQKRLNGENDYNDEQEVVYDEIDVKCMKEKYVIASTEELHQISDCSTIVGSIKIASFDNEIIDFGFISNIRGDLQIANSSNLVKIQGRIEKICGNFKLDTLTSLGSISLPLLQQVSVIDWNVLPVLSSVRFDKGVNKVNSILISDTSLTGFSGFDVNKLEILKINNNRYLEKIESNVKEITGELIVSANARYLELSLAELQSVKHLTIRDVDKLNISNLQIIEKTGEFINNRFEKLSLDKLKLTGNTLSLMDNDELKEIETPRLEEVGGGLMIIDNKNLKNINFLNEIKSVGGAIEFDGFFKNVELPKLKIVKGSTLIRSTDDDFHCEKWIKEEMSRVITVGKIQCGTKNENIIAGDRINGLRTYKGNGNIDLDDIESIYEDDDDIESGSNRDYFGSSRGDKFKNGDQYKFTEDSKNNKTEKGKNDPSSRFKNGGIDKELTNFSISLVNDGLFYKLLLTFTILIGEVLLLS
ncbi:unnamed protein product [[Candida] boidinii]|uniref:Unnamed protein product n=1 Tax=Candida boidinii TaxID=5477 RepID=A0A9W6SY57_CANBO|nr:hypothetical protein B5S30_g3490 [[Candida] boidinii]OWB83364.1 hypothetical protein B5S33_g1993 [[Candida] boidinii]GME68453.1 unnamed protein product [[Candida] boidinii]GME94440.1 unnamed protein product [[Candida] boidinii]GMF99975.1 unnamed protein product [[Candida] boidinii]